MLALLGTRRFWPLCLTQACGALNDNLVRNALVVLALFKAGAAGPVLVALAGGPVHVPLHAAVRHARASLPTATTRRG